jgi:hypothetical protein
MEAPRPAFDYLQTAGHASQFVSPDGDREGKSQQDANVTLKRARDTVSPRLDTDMVISAPGLGLGNFS